MTNMASPEIKSTSGKMLDITNVDKMRKSPTGVPWKSTYMTAKKQQPVIANSNVQAVEQ